MVVLSWDGDAKNDDDSSLMEEALAVARKELREDESTRNQALSSFREWIAQNRDLEDCRTDNSFLLRFLRCKKFSLPMAQTMLLKYINLRQTFPQFFMNLDYLHPPVLELINSGYLFASPRRDKKGRRVLLASAENFDPYKYSCWDQARVHMITYETLMENELNQIFGYNHVADLKSGSVAHVTLWPVMDFATIAKWGEQSVPMRHKEVNLIHLPGPVKYVYDFALTRLSQKIRERFVIHDSFDDLLKSVEPRLLPKEWGGEIPMADMIESWKNELAAKRDTLLKLDSIKLLDNSSILKKREVVGAGKGKGLNEDYVVGSFRKLEVD